MAKKKDVIKAAKELNEKLGLDPQIDVNEKSSSLKQQVAEAGGLVEQDDNVGEETQAVINDLREDGWQNVESEETDEETPADEPAPKSKDKGKNKPKSESTKSMTRIEATVQVIKEAIASNDGVNKSDVAEMANEMYQSHGGSDNAKSANWVAGYAINILLTWGTIDVDDDGTIIQGEE